MQTLQLTAHVENNGFLQIKLPPEYSGQDVDLVLRIQPQQKIAMNVKQKWQEFVKQTYGSCANDPLTRPEELPMAMREELL